MKKVKVIVRDRNTLVIEEDASKGDYIDLSELNEIDYKELENVIEEGKDYVYNKKLSEYKHTLDLENNQKIEESKKGLEKIINDLKSELSLLNKEKDSLLKEKEYEVEKKFNQKINDLNKEIELLKNNKDSELARLKNEYDLKIIDLNHKLSTKDKENEYNLKDKENDLNNKMLKELNKQKEDYEEKLKDKDNKINEILRQKASLNVKQTGEDLEAWCHNEVVSYMQNGLFNCTWIKDNKVVKEDDETKGSKADYIFNVFASEKHLDDELLTNVCLDMKDENPDSINKKSNSDYYKQLDKNRIKKECKYAVLVSNLETDKPNDLPLFKVNEYKDMYVVRPAYLMTFLNMITSLTVRFKEMVLADKKEKLDLKNSLDLLEEFNNLKNTYLDKPLESLEKNITDILSQSDSIRKASNKITESCEKIVNNYINDIENKLSKFEIKINKSYKKNN